MTDNKTFRCRLMTPQEVVLEADAKSVIFPATDGLMGILAGHAPLMATLGSGSLTIRSGHVDHEYHVSGGLAHVAENEMVVLAEVCLPKAK